MGYKICEIERGLNKAKNKEVLTEVEERPSVYSELEIRGSVYIVHAISDEFKVVGVKRVKSKKYERDE